MPFFMHHFPVFGVELCCFETEWRIKSIPFHCALWMGSWRSTTPQRRRREVVRPSAAVSLCSFSSQQWKCLLTRCELVFNHWILLQVSNSQFIWNLWAFIFFCSDYNCFMCSLPRLVVNYVTLAVGQLLLLILTVCSLAAIFPRVGN